MSPAEPALLAERIARVRGRIEEAAGRAGRDPATVRLVAVSKTFPAEAVAEAALGGVRVFGENRVQEAAGKIPRVAQILGHVRPPDLAWHLVGHLQSNKAKQAASLFDLIHSVDDADLAQRLDHAAGEQGRRLPVLIQVNVAAEERKSGVSEAGLRPLVDAVLACPALELRGLMTIPPYDPDRSRRHFAALRELGEAVRRWQAGSRGAVELSMGMSEDFEAAIEEGATIVRVGRALFGERAPG